MGLFSFLFRALRKVAILLANRFLSLMAFIRLKGNGVKFNRTLVCNGLPIVDVHRTATCKIGGSVVINSNIHFNPIGRYCPTFLIVREKGVLTIGDHTGISSSAIICHHSISIGKHVKLGGNVAIYDTDFHSLDLSFRMDKELDKEGTISKPVVIEDNVFVGAHSTILKGVVIGKGSIIGACSVVTKSIPENEIWAGNPARFIKRIGNE